MIYRDDEMTKATALEEELAKCHDEIDDLRRQLWIEQRRANRREVFSKASMVFVAILMFVIAWLFMTIYLNNMRSGTTPYVALVIIAVAGLLACQKTRKLK